jgi:hypothetical protein
MTPWKHAESSASKYGGTPEEYISIHDWFDETKQYTGDFTHRALRHHAAGIQWCIDRFGHTIELKNGKRVAVKLIAEQHVVEDCGFVPTVADWLGSIKESPADWMLKVAKKSVREMVLSE